jgi:CDGSH-type Zn-finger protein
MADGQIKVTVRDNGPLLVEGKILLCDVEGNALATDPAKLTLALCRCGHTARAPFCDGSHKTCGYSSIVRASSG